MRAVIADTGPLNYLLLVGEIEILPRLFEAVLIPRAVAAELAAEAAPPIVRDWIAQPPHWLQVEPNPGLPAASPKLDAGEEAAIALALELKIHLLVMDDRAGVKAALARGLDVVGTLGVLDQAALRGLIELPAVLTRLTATNFRISPQLVDALLAKHGERPGTAP